VTRAGGRAGVQPLRSRPIGLVEVSVKKLLLLLVLVAVGFLIAKKVRDA
jgi:hypothetical protein